MDIVTRLRAAIHLESAAIAPQTSALIEAAKEAADEIERLRMTYDQAMEREHGLKLALIAHTLRYQ